jgi:exopolysaccharide biosynthesis polyprenyl glycosylphosphotransferase
MFSATATRRVHKPLHLLQNRGMSDAPLPPDAGMNGKGASEPSRAPVFRGRRVQLIYAFIDVCCVIACDVVAFLLRFPPAGSRDLISPNSLVGMDHRYAGFLLLDVGLILLFCQSERLYRTPLETPFTIESTAVVKAISFSTLLLTTFIYLSGVKIVSRLVVTVSALLNIVALIAWRYAKRKFIIHRIERGIGTRNTLIVGAGRVGQALAQLIEDNKLLGYRFVGFLDGNHSTDPRTLGSVEDVGRVAREHFVDEVFVTIPSERELVKSIAFSARQQRLAVNVIPDLYDGLGWNAPLRRLGHFPVMGLHWTPIPGPGRFAKRLMDVTFSAVGLVLCAPLLPIFAVIIRWDSPGPVLYRSQRVGRKGLIFSCYKLRTMVADADALKESLRDCNERKGPFFKISNDPRVTRVGNFLRRYSLDELPQLWNVLVGDMSIVGPRPHPIDDYKQYGLDHLQRLEVKPGITGLWQVTARRDPSFEKSMRLDLEYIENWNLRLDFEIMVRTLATVARAEGC